MQSQIKEDNCELKDSIVTKENILLPSRLETAIDNIVKKESFLNHNVVKRMISTEGGNYLSVLYEIDVKGKKASGEKEINIFVKSILPSDNIKFFSIPDVFLKELYAYTELAKVFTEVQDNSNVPTEERFKMVKSYDESYSEAILLENLTMKGFNTYHRMDVISLKFAQLSMQQLAKFHGLSLVLKHLRPEYFNLHIKTMKFQFNFNEEFNGFVRNMVGISTKKLRDDTKTKAENYIEVILDKLPKYMAESSLIGACLCHGDFRANNVLMKTIEGEISELIPVDFQLLYYGCPLDDLFFFIFNGTDQQFRRQHMTNLKNMYYETLVGFLKYFDMDLEIIYPRKEFERQYTERLEYGLMISLYFLPLSFAAEDNIPDPSKDDATKMQLKLDPRFEERIQGIVDDYIQWGYL